MQSVLLLVALASTPVYAVRPNFLIILIDDMAWNDPGFAGNPAGITPGIDALARSGMVFPQAYAAAPNCAPTRASLLTGQYTPRHGVFTVVDERNAPGRPEHPLIAADSRAELDTSATTIAEVLRAGGYRTGMTGMWNLGRGRNGPCTPTGQGFDRFVHPRDLGFGENAYRNERGEYLCDRMTDAAIDFIHQGGKPFFCYLAYHDVHAPFDPPPDLAARFPGQPFEATLAALDRNITRLTTNLPPDTYVFFTSDNGGAMDTVQPLRGGKGALYEGGIRVPFLATGPGIPSSSTSSVPVLSIDLFPTLIALSGLDTPAGVTLDGRSLIPIWSGGAFERERIFWHFPCYAGKGTPSSAVRSGPWKLIEFFDRAEPELYHLDLDPGERSDRAASETGTCARLLAELRTWQQHIQAPCPRERNPDFDPGARGKRGKRSS